jgi:hypothetical protein
VDGGPQLAITQIVGAGLTEQEQATIRNVGDQLADLEGWTLSDAEGNTYVFPNYRLWPQSSVTVHTGIGQDGEPLSSLFWGRLESVWRPGEMATLRNAEGLALATYVVNP